MDPQNTCQKSRQVWWRARVIPALRRQRQVDPWDYLAQHPSLISKSQGSVRDLAYKTRLMVSKE